MNPCVMAHILIVDDEQSICWALARLAAEMGHTAATEAAAEAGLKSAQSTRPDVIVLDVRLPGMDGLAAMEHFRAIVGPVPIIVVTAFGDLATAVSAVRNGAFDYLLKPFALNVAEQAIDRALRCASLPPETEYKERENRDDVIVGISPGMQEVYKRIAVVAPSDACVHIRGESGSGKELVARAIHRYSRRLSAPFIAVNVAALSPSLAESELFGHVKGAFTGADQARKGFLEQAHGGTIFLDEIADIPMPLQVKLLRVLEHGEIMPVGGEQAIHSDFRLISATHQNLGRRVAEGAFRHDLYFRLITFEIEIPPLRERREDIKDLAEHFLDVFTAKNQGSRPSLAPETLAELQRRDWCGNVRELRNAVEHAVILARGGMIVPEHLPPPMGTVPIFVSTKMGLSPLAQGPVNMGDQAEQEAIPSLIRQWAASQLQGAEDAGDLYEQMLKIVEPPLFQAALEHHHNQCKAAARRLGIHRTTLRKKLDEFAANE
jgi:two-component system, NtrC family, nitrogen regulation response regulator GlnG